jgi:hypothetical protein
MFETTSATTKKPASATKRNEYFNGAFQIA